jgi:LPS sulfotransferase NodH
MLALDRNSSAFDFPPVRGRALDYFIASTPHSGVRLLNEALRATGRAGAPQEYFGREPMSDLAKRWGVGTIDSYIRALRRHRTTGGGVFGFSAHYHQFEDQIGPELMTEHFGDIRPILFRRGDRLGQAAEWAQATLLARAECGEAAPKVPRFDAKLVDDLADQIAFEESGWRDYFRALGVVPHEVIYEDLIRDYKGTVGAVFGFLGLEAPAEIDSNALTAAENKPTDLWAWRSRRSAGHGRRPSRALLLPPAVGTLRAPTPLRGGKSR